MKHLLYALLTAVSILFTSCGPSSNTNTPQEPNVPQPQPQPQPEVTQKVVIGYLALDDWEFENLFPTIEWKYLTHINASFVQSPNQKIPDRKTKCVIKTHINIKQNVIFGAKLKPV